MVSKFAILSNLFLVSTTLASSSSRPGARLAHHGENHQSQPIKRIESYAVKNEYHAYGWAGAVWYGGSDGTFTSIQGTFNVPQATSPSGSTGESVVVIWAGIDGLNCTDAFLQTGIEVSVSKDGVASYFAWYQWYPDNSYYFGVPLKMSPGQLLKATIVTDSKTSGTVTILNLATGQNVTQPVTSSTPLCLRDVAWILQDPSSDLNGYPASFADFGTVTISNAVASGSSGNQHTPQSGATTFIMEQNGNVLTSVNINGDGVVIESVKTSGWCVVTLNRSILFICVVSGLLFRFR